MSIPMRAIVIEELQKQLAAALADVERLTAEVSRSQANEMAVASVFQECATKEKDARMRADGLQQDMERLTGERDALREKVRGWAAQIDCPGCSPEHVVIGCLMREATHD